MVDKNFFYVDANTFSPSYAFFSGYAVVEDSLILGQDGFDEYLLGNSAFLNAPTVGRFVGCFPLKGCSVIRADDMGQELLFLYKDQRGFWASSNSFWLLVYNLKRSGVALEFNEASSLAFYLKNGTHIGEQLLSSCTPVKNISLLSSTKYLEIRHADRCLSVKGSNMYDYLSSFSEPADDLIVSHLEDQVRATA